LSEFSEGSPAGQHECVSLLVATLSAATHGTPTGAAFDLVLILHVGFMLVGLASLLATGIQAWRARRGPEAPSAPSVARYFRPGINWPGRSIYLVLVFGLTLVAMSRGAYGFSDPFVQIGLVLWIVAVSLAEMLVWPGERLLQVIVSGADSSGGGSGGAGGAGGAGAGGSGAAGSGAAGSGGAGGALADTPTPLEGNASPEVVTTWEKTGQATAIATRVALSAWTVCAVFVFATVVMVQKP
jgi:hypothetical protein